MLCKLYLEHYDIGDDSYLEPVSFLELYDKINSFDFVKVMKPNELDLFAMEDWFGNDPYWEEYMEDVKKCESIVVYGESGGTSFNAITQFNFA